MKKRIISLALCFLLVFSHVLPVAAVDSSEPACSGSCEDTTSAATHTADCAVYAYYESMSAKGAQHMYENWDAISESDRANLLIWLDAHNPDMAAELRALLTPAAEESTPTETTVPAEPQPAVEEKTLESGEFSVTGKDIPEGAELIIGEFPMPYSADTPAVSMYNIKVYDGDEVWQPANGETVEVSIPVTDASAETVDVMHFLEDPDKIIYALENGIGTKMDFSDVPEELHEVFESAIQGYQEATNSEDICVVVETFKNVPVIDDKVTVDANGFSIFIENENGEYVDAGTNFNSLPDTVYVRPGEWITFTTNILDEGWDGVGVFHIPENNITGSVEESNFLQIWSVVYFQVENGKPGETFTVQFGFDFWGSFRPRKTVTFVIVDYFENANVMIEVLPNSYNGYPAEPAITESNEFHYYQSSGTLGIDYTKHIYTTKVSHIIDTDAVETSSYYQVNADETAYGVADTTGAATSAVLSHEITYDENGEIATLDFDTIADDILTEYCATNNLTKDNYKLVVYVVKYEAVGTNIGWHIGCKVELKSNFILSYDYNAPAPLTAFDIGDTKKPNDQSVATYDTNGNPLETVTANVGSGKGMELNRAIGTQNYKATFVGWSNNPNADPANVNVDTEDTVWYSANEQIIMTGDTTLYAIWQLSWKPNIADVEFQKLIVDENGNAVSGGSDTFTFTVSSNFGDRSYKTYTSDGITQVSSGIFAADALTFTLKNGEYIVISEVPNDNNNAYTITESAFDGYTPQTGNYTHTFNITDTTNTSGKFSYDFYNVLKKYSVTYVDGVDNEEIPVPSAQDKIYGTDLTLSATVPVRTGYDFTGWLGSDGKEYQPGGTYKGNAALTLTAQWELKTYTVTYNTNGGTGTFEAQTKEYGIALTLHSDVPVKEGYSFSGWLGNDGNTYQPGDTYTGNAALTLTAQWEAIVADLTIKTELNASAPYADQNFVFIVTGDPDDKNIDTITIEVALDGNDEVVIGNMPAGTYTVTEKSGWTWRYNGIQPAKAIVDSDGDTVTFTFGEPDNKLWLSGYHYGKK